MHKNYIIFLHHSLLSGHRTAMAYNINKGNPQICPSDMANYRYTPEVSKSSLIYMYLVAGMGGNSRKSALISTSLVEASVMRLDTNAFDKKKSWKRERTYFLYFDAIFCETDRLTIRGHLYLHHFNIVEDLTCWWDIMRGQFDTTYSIAATMVNHGKNFNQKSNRENMNAVTFSEAHVTICQIRDSGKP